MNKEEENTHILNTGESPWYDGKSAGLKVSEFDPQSRHYVHVIHGKGIITLIPSAMS